MTPFEELLARRRDRAIAIVLGVKERECDNDLSARASQKLRKVILDQFNDLTDIALDVMRSLDTGTVILNEEYLKKLDHIYTSVVEEDRSDQRNGTLEVVT